MNHFKISEKLSAYYDKRLSPPERWEVEGHLVDCAACRQTLRDWQSTASFLFVKPVFSEWNEDLFTQKVMARLESAPAPAEPAWKPLLQWALPLAGSLAAAAWVWGAVFPTLPGLASDNSMILGGGSQLSSAPLAPPSFESPSGAFTVSLISYDEGQ